MTREADSFALSNLLRLRAWRLALSGPLLFSYFSLFYLLLLKPGRLAPSSVFLLLVALLSYFANGFLVNDLADRESDLVAGAFTPSRGHLSTKLQLRALVAATFLVGASAVYLCSGGPIFDGLWVLAYVCSFLYSAPPFSLKRRGASGAIADSLIERPLPILIIFAYFGYYGLETLLFPILSEVSWSVFKHQVADVDLDQKSGVKTLAVRLGKDRAYRILKLIVNPVSVLAQYALIAFAYINLPTVRIGVLMAALLMTAGIGGAVVFGRRIAIRTTPTDPPYVMSVNFCYKIVVLPVLAVYVVLSEPFLLLVGFLLAASLFPHLRDYSRIFARSFGPLSSRSRSGALA